MASFSLKRERRNRPVLVSFRCFKQFFQRVSSCPNWIRSNMGTIYNRLLFRISIGSQVKMRPLKKHLSFAQKPIGSRPSKTIPLSPSLIRISCPIPINPCSYIVTSFSTPSSVCFWHKTNARPATGKCSCSLLFPPLSLFPSTEKAFEFKSH